MASQALVDDEARAIGRISYDTTGQLLSPSKVTCTIKSYLQS